MRGHANVLKNTNRVCKLKPHLQGHNQVINAAGLPITRSERQQPGLQAAWGHAQKQAPSRRRSRARIAQNTTPQDVLAQ